MSPILLKLKGSEESLPLFSNLDEQELSKTWRICTKVKDALENGSRLENLSWRLWFLQNVNDTNSKNKHESPAAISRPQETVVALHCSSSTDVEDTKPNNFILNQFSSDQEGDQMIELRDIIQHPMENQHFTTTMYNDTIHQGDDASLFEQSFAYYDNNPYNLTNLEGPSYVITNVSQPLTTDHNVDTVTYYHTEIPSMTIPVDTKHIYYNTVPNATLHNKLLATLPKQTLASAEKLLTPTTTTTTTTTTYPQQQHYYAATTTTNTTFDTTFQINQMSQSYPNLNNIYLSNETNSNNSISNESTEEDNTPICSNCGATSTPLWRRSDKKILCNACGLYLKLHNIPRPKHLKPLQGELKTGEEEETQQHQTPVPTTTCSNCGTSKTPLWRRDMEGAPLCNACGLYFKLHKEKRPLSMKTDTIKKRQRTEALLVNSTASGQLKKPKYLDHLSLYSFAAKGKNASVATSLPGTGVLMMTPISNQ